MGNCPWMLVHGCFSIDITNEVADGCRPSGSIHEHRFDAKSIAYALYEFVIHITISRLFFCKKHVTSKRILYVVNMEEVRGLGWVGLGWVQQV